MGGAGGTERYIAKRWGAVQRLKYVPFPQFSGRRARVACPSLPEDLRRDFSFSFPFSFHLKNVVFGRSLVQLILVALSLYPFGVKEGGLFLAPQALDSRFLGLPGLDSSVLAPPGLDPGVVGLLGPEPFLPAPAPGKF